jgi:hypothetical protein
VTSTASRCPLASVTGVVATLSLAFACGGVEPSPPGGGTGATAGAGVGGAGGSSAGRGSGGSMPTGGTGAVAGKGGTGGTGGTGGSGGSAGNPEGGVGGAPPPVGGELSDCTTPGPRMIRRLSSIQFRNTLTAAFQDEGVPVADVLTDPAIMKFRVDADAPVVRDLDAALLLDHAEKVAAWAVANKLSSLTPCTNKEDRCERELISTLGLRLYREPVTEETVAAYRAMFAAEQTFADGAAVVIATMLQSPRLLYRRELGNPDSAEPGRFALTPHEIASELSYFLLDSAPDAALLDAAANGRLDTREEIDREASRLLATQAAKAPIARFATGWLELDGLLTKAKDDATFMLTAALRSSMLTEAAELFTSTFASGGDVPALLTANHTFVDSGLAAFYGLPSPGGGFQRVDLTGSQRAPGLLGQAGFLTAHAQPENSSPTQRGRFVRERFLCEPIPEMPTDLDTNLASGANFATNRERYETHASSPACRGCHAEFDPVGFVFEHYDGFGRYREREKDTPIDATGLLTGLPGGDVALDGVESLVEVLASEDRVRACLVRYWSYYAHGRDNWTEKKCNDDSVRREAMAGNYSLQSVLSGILHAPTFTRRVQDH